MTLASASIGDPQQRRFAASRAGQTTLLLGCWAIVACSSLAAAFGRLPDGLSNDDAMRLVGVRDLLAGQPWFDLTQYRLGPAGSLMHWSRLIDLPVALLLWLLQRLVDTPLAERLAVAIWPLLVLLPALAGMRALGRALHGAAAGNLALVLGTFLVPLIGHFRPGAVDHHNVQLALLLWAAAWTVRSGTRDALLAACAMGLSVAIGLEMLPGIAALAACNGARWIAEGERFRRQSIAFGAAFAAATCMFLIATVPAARWFVPACDALSVAHLTAAVVAGAGAALLAATCSGRSPTERLMGTACLGLAVVAGVALVAPDCLGSPYASVHPRLKEFWLANVAETQSLLSTLQREPVEALALYVPPLVALLLSALAAMKARDEAVWRWVSATTLQFVLLAVAIWEFRGTAAANAVASALLAAALIKLLPPQAGAPLLFGQRRASLAAALALTPLLLAVGGHSVARAARWMTGTMPPEQPLSRAMCHDVSSFSALAELPPGRVLAFIDSGAFILMQTRHSVLAAPYHRNNDGNLAAVDAFLASPPAARAHMRRNGIAYVAICAGAPEFELFRRAADDGLAAQLARRNVPAWLQPVALGDSPLQVYRLVPEGQR